MHKVLFVCTANVFRSLTAEYALRRLVGHRTNIQVASAGTADRWYDVPPYISSCLRTHGLDVSGHRRRTLTADMLHPSVTVIAMSTDHRELIARHFGRYDVLLFTEACGLPPAPLLDVHEAIPDYASNLSAAEAHVRTTIDRIVDLTPDLASRLLRYRAA